MNGNSLYTFVQTVIMYKSINAKTVHMVFIHKPNTVKNVKTPIIKALRPEYAKDATAPMNEEVGKLFHAQ